VIVIRTYVVSRLFYEADRGPRLAALPENRPRRNQRVSRSILTKSPVGPSDRVDVLYTDSLRGYQHTDSANTIPFCLSIHAKPAKPGCTLVWTADEVQYKPSTPARAVTARLIPLLFYRFLFNGFKSFSEK
jgi:hypothetical protein